MSVFTRLAPGLEVDERTLRRAARQGLIRTERVSERREVLRPGEERYLRDHWRLLSALRRALRTEPSVRVAVVFGSVARGDDTPMSDVDILVELHHWDAARAFELEQRLARAVGRNVEVIGWEQARANGPLWGEIASEGRVLVDRDHRWPAVAASAATLRAAAEQRLVSRAAAALQRARSG